MFDVLPQSAPPATISITSHNPSRLLPFDVGCSMLNVRCSAAKRAPGHHLNHATRSPPPPPLRCSMFDVECSMFCRKARTGHHLKTSHNPSASPSMLDVRCWMFDVLPQSRPGHHLNHVSRSAPPPSVRCSAARSVAARSQFPTRTILATQILIGFRDVRYLHAVAVNRTSGWPVRPPCRG